MLEVLSASDAKQAAESHSEQLSCLSRQLQEALGTLAGRENEMSVLRSQQVTLANKVKRLQAALRDAVLKTRQKVIAAKAASEDAVFQRLSEWRESLVKTTIEAAQCCSVSCQSTSSSSLNSSGWRCLGKEARLPEAQEEICPSVSDGLARRHAAAELAILELTEALRNANVRLACRTKGTISEKWTSDIKDEEDREEYQRSSASDCSDPSGTTKTIPQVHLRRTRWDSLPFFYCFPAASENRRKDTNSNGLLSLSVLHVG